MKGTKRLSTLITAVITASVFTLGAAAASHNYRGDVNRDGKVTKADISYLQDHLTSKKLISQKNRPYADVNGDGTINIIDLILMKRMVTGAAEKQEYVETTPAVTTTAVTTTTTTASTSATTASTTKASTTTSAATTKASTTTTTAATQASTTTTTASTQASTTTTTAATQASTTTTTSATQASTTTTTTTASTQASTTTTTTQATTTTTTTQAATTTTTTQATTTTTTTQATTTTTATETTVSSSTSVSSESETAVSKTYPEKIGNGVNDIADVSEDRAWIVLGGTIDNCKYDENTNQNDFVPGSVKMPKITGDGNYTASFYVYDEAIIRNTSSTSISYTFLKILKANTWDVYRADEKPDLKITVTGAVRDGERVSADALQALTQDDGAAVVRLDSVLGEVNNFEVEFKIEGFDSTAGTTPVTPEPSSGSTRTVTLTQNKAFSVNDSRLELTADMLNEGEEIENVILRFSPADGKETIGGINFNFRTSDYQKVNKNIQTTVSDASYVLSLADVMNDSEKANLSNLTSSDTFVLERYWLENEGTKLDSIEFVLKS